MARHHTRCRKCRARRALPQAPSLYVVWPTCERGGCDGKLASDKWMNERNTGAMLCRCDGPDFEYHRHGTQRCKYNWDRSPRYPDVELPALPGEYPF